MAQRGGDSRFADGGFKDGGSILIGVANVEEDRSGIPLIFSASKLVMDAHGGPATRYM